MPEENRTQQATLGCGTLILIGLIVLFFSRPGINEIEYEVRTLRKEVSAVKTAVEAQSDEIRRLSDKLAEKK